MPLGFNRDSNDSTSAQVPALGSWWQARSHFVVKRDQSNRVLLGNHQVSQGGGQTDRVVEFCQFLLVRVSHRLTQIHDQVARDIGLRLKFLDVILVGLGEDLPVNILQVVAVRVLAMFAELDTEPVKRTGVQSVQETLHDELGPQVKSLDLVDDFRFKVFFDRH